MSHVLSALGAIWLISLIIRLRSFVWFYFLRPSTIKRYLHGPKPYALITGASDGIGKALATELYDRGFNLILHGRNEQRIRNTIGELKKRATARGTTILYFLADASQSGHDFAQLVAPFRDLDITLVFHNVGGEFHAQAIDEQPEDQLVGTVRWNDVFALLLTRALLPRLRETARRGRVLVHFVGSVAADVAPARLTTYSASKAFLRALARGLDNDEQVWGAPSGVRFAYLNLSFVQTGAAKLPASLTVPTAERFARAVVATTGCGRRKYAPYWAHAVLIWLTEVVESWGGEGVVDRKNAAFFKAQHQTMMKHE